MTAVAAATLAVGSLMAYDGGVWKVVDLGGTRVTITTAGGRTLSVAITRLLSAPGSRLLEADPTPMPGVGQLFASLPPAVRDEVKARVAHVQEVLTGFRSGDPDDALPGEPRPEYGPGTPKMARYQAKAAELGMPVGTLRDWLRAYKQQGAVGLLDGRHCRESNPLGGVDSRWLDMLQSVLAEHTAASRPPVHLLLERVAARVAELHGPDAVSIPKDSKARAVLREITKGTNAIRGSTKGKRTIQSRPDTPYRRLRATRPGEYLLLDSTRLDVFAMEPVTLRWISLELSVAMDLFSRCIVALRLSPVSTKSVDAAVLLYEAICADSKAHTSGGLLPYTGLPSVVLVDNPTERKGLPAMAPETMIVDHGRIYVSSHLRSVCARLGISIQPGRLAQATDKACLERFFKTVREGLLAALPGYKGPDLHSRGEHVENEAYYFSNELEQILREWLAEVYHLRPHGGLVEPSIPGLDLCPMDMLELGVARAGRVRVPARADLVYDFLPVEWRTIQHYGIDMFNLRFDGDGIEPHRNRKSPYGGVHEGKWPIRYDPDDVSRVFFQDPENHTWHSLRWVHAADVPVPFSEEVLELRPAAGRRHGSVSRHPPEPGRAARAMGCRADTKPHRATHGSARL